MYISFRHRLNISHTYPYQDASISRPGTSVTGVCGAVLVSTTAASLLSRRSRLTIPNFNTSFQGHVTSSEAATGRAPHQLCNKSGLQVQCEEKRLSEALEMRFTFLGATFTHRHPQTHLQTYTHTHRCTHRHIHTHVVTL